MTRDEYIKSIRPQIDLPADGYHSDMEAFQNLTLRPILKLQHDATAHFFMGHKHFPKTIVSIISEDVYNQAVTNFLKKDHIFRNTIIGMIIGHFTSSELDYYRDNKSDIHKRIISMQIKRYVSSFYILKAKS